MKQCPFCGRELTDDVRFCAACMNSLEEKSEIRPYRPRTRIKKICILLAVGLLLLILTAWAIPYAAAGAAAMTGGLL